MIEKGAATWLTQGCKNSYTCIFFTRVTLIHFQNTLLLSLLNENITRKRKLSHCSTLCKCRSHQIKFKTRINRECIVKHRKHAAALALS